MSSIRITKIKDTINISNMIIITESVNLLTLLQDRGYNIAADCAGNGTCGKCLVTICDDSGERVVKACKEFVHVDPNASDNIDDIIMDVFIKETPPKTEGEIETGRVDNRSEESSISAYNNLSGSDSTLYCGYSAYRRSGLGCAVDLGTTTVVVSVIDLATGRIIGTASEWNCQSKYGSDVISRIDYCLKKPSDLSIMGRQIRRQVRSMIQGIIDDAKVNDNIEPDDLSLKDGAYTGDKGSLSIREVVISGNTVMQHIFAEIDPSPMATAPYTPKCFFNDDFTPPFEYPEFDDCILVFSPCISGFVGGDISSGILASGMKKSDSISLLLDIGTNGEMVLKSGNEMLCCSVATGPAFEGAHISCGMRSIVGAINHISLISDMRRGGQPALKLSIIGETAPSGICGSAMIELLAILLNEGVVDDTGRLLCPEEAPLRMRHFISSDENGNGIFWIDRDYNIYLTAGDVRQLQLAKAAVAAGIEVLLTRASISPSQVDKVMISGGFGKHLDSDSIARIGLIPEELKGKIESIGNSSLSGAELLLQMSDSIDEIQQITNECKHLELSLDKDFSDLYIGHMTFN